MSVVLWLLCTFAGWLLPASACEDPSWRIVVFPDTQHYAEDYPHHVEDMTAWIAEQADDVDLVLHVGDVVDDNHDQAQWETVSDAFAALDDAGVPYVLAAGNHDYSAYDETQSERTSSYWQTFGQLRQGLDDTRGESGYRIVELGGEPWLILSLELFPRTETLVWADAVLTANPDIPSIIVTHAYLNVDGSRFGEPDAYPWPYGLEAMRGVVGADAWDAETIYHQLIVPHSQVELVLSGHVLGEGVGQRTDVRGDGSTVTQIVQNYQSQLEGGLGFLRIYEGYSDRIDVSTYSPIVDYELTGSAHRFTIPKR